MIEFASTTDISASSRDPCEILFYGAFEARSACRANQFDPQPVLRIGRRYRDGGGKPPTRYSRDNTNGPDQPAPICHLPHDLAGLSIELALIRRGNVTPIVTPALRGSRSVRISIW